LALCNCAVPVFGSAQVTISSVPTVVMIKGGQAL
jgi:hypothetical protein